MKCTDAQPMLSLYMDSSLSARATFELQKHLVDCHECTRALNEMRRTADLLAEAPRYEVGADFSVRLEARLQRLELKPARATWIDRLRPAFVLRLASALAVAAAACVMALSLVLPNYIRRPLHTRGDAAASSAASVQDAVRQNVALSATDPFSDLGTANLTAHASYDTANGADTSN